MAPTKKIILVDRDDPGKIIGAPEILWPPPAGEPDIIFAKGKSFVRIPGSDGQPRYMLARALSITNYD